MVADPERTGVIAVATAEEMPVNETLALREALREDVGLELDAVVVNALLPDRFSAGDAEALAARPGRASRTAASLHARARSQREQLERLRSGLGPGVPVLTLPFVVAADLGPGELGLLAGELAP
jgi:hypothetical protein